MKRKEREALARECIAVLTANGATGEIRPVFKGLRETDTALNAAWPELEAMITIGGVNHPLAGVHFHSAKRDLCPHRLFDSISTYHRRKATTFRHHARLVEYLKNVCDAIRAEEVFGAATQS